MSWHRPRLQYLGTNIQQGALKCSTFELVTAQLLGRTSRPVQRTMSQPTHEALGVCLVMTKAAPRFLREIDCIAYYEQLNLVPL